jgi:MFS family permease
MRHRSIVGAIHELPAPMCACTRRVVEAWNQIGRIEGTTLSQETLSRTGAINRYQELLAAPGVPLMVLAGVIGRIPSTMLELALPLVVAGRTGSWVSAGLVTAAYTIASAALGPIRGRLVDRAGARTILFLTGWGQAFALIGLVLAVVISPRLVWLTGFAILAGALTPPVGPIMRVLWSRLERPDLREAAFAFESITIDILYIVGPSLVALLIAIAPINVCLITAAALVALGPSLLALAPGASAARPEARSTHWLGALRAGAVRRMLPVSFLVSGSFTATDLGIIAFASAHHAKALSGILIASMSVGSIVGGLYWGSRRQPGTLRQQLTALLLALTAGTVLLIFSGSILLFGIISVFVGLALSPAITAMYSLMDTVAPRREITESFAWLGTSGNAGGAVAVAIAGLFVTRMHHTGGFVVAALLIGSAALLCALLAPVAPPHADS